MKNITFLFFSLIAFYGYAQSLEVNPKSEAFISKSDSSTFRNDCTVDNDDFFSGLYTMEETTGNADGFGGNYGPHYPPVQEVMIQAAGINRLFDFLIYPDSFVFDQTATIVLNCGEIEYTTTALTGTLGCTGGANTIEDIHAIPLSTYDKDLILDDVIEFDVEAMGLDDGGCDIGSYMIHLKFTKGVLSVSESNSNEIGWYILQNNMLHVAALQTIGRIALFSISGQQVLTQSIDRSNFNIDISSLHSGLYLARMEDAFGRKQTIKFIKQ